MLKIPDVLELLKAGAHFGHKISKWHPKMAPFIFTERNQVHIINLEETQKKLQEALNFLRQSAAQNKIILFVGTKDQAQEIITRHAKDVGVPYVTNRWLGGLLTNFNEIHILIKKFRRLKTERDTGELGKYTKKEQIHIGKEIVKMEKYLSGIESLERRPDIIFIIDLKKEKTALNEALLCKTKIVALCDTNVNPDKIDYPIPSNDDAIKTIELITGLAAEAVKEGKNQAASVVAAPAVSVPV
jgi:small subunit ribosomal protein S2